MFGLLRCRRARLGVAGALLIGLGLPSVACEDPRFIIRTPPGERLDVFQQTAVPIVDILWVVDNSKSMAEEQQALAENFSYFYDYLLSIYPDDDVERDGFHIGVISTDVYSEDHRGRLHGPVISQATPGADDVFAENVRVGIDGKGDEQGFYAATLALGEPLISTYNVGFLRSDAFLFLIFVSDEDDKSFGEVPYFLRHFEQIKGIGNDGMINIAAIVEIEAGTCPDAEPGVRYSQLAESAGGIAVSICEQNFADNLDALGFSAAGLKRSFSLSEAAIPATVTVYVKTRCDALPLPEDVCENFWDDCRDHNGYTCEVRQALPDGWAYEEDSASIRFFGRAVPPFGAIVEVGYIPQEESQ